MAKRRRHSEEFKREAVKLVTDQGFAVQKVEPVHSVYQTLAWIVERWLGSSQSPGYVLLRSVLFPILRYQCRR